MIEFISNWWNAENPRKHVLGFYEAMKPFHDANCKKWYSNLAMQVGNQWSSYIDGIFREDWAPDWRVRATFNKLLPLTIMQKHTFMPNNPTITVRPANNNSEVDKKNANTSRMLLKALWKSKKFKKKINKMVDWMIPCTAGYVMALWDGRAGAQIDDKAYMGELVYDAPSPFEIVLDYSVDDFDDMPRFIRMKIRSVDYIKHKYNKDVKAEDLTYNDMYQLRVQALSTMGSIDITKALGNHVLVFEMWELPSHKYPSGFHHICTKTKDLIDQEDLGHNYKVSNDSKEYFLGLRQAQSVRLPGRLIGTNGIEQAGPMQCYYNKGKSEIIENIKRLGRPKIFSPKGKIPIGAMLENPAEIVVDYDPDIEGEIIIAKPPEMAQYHLRHIADMPGEMQDAFGIHEATQGVLPRRATSGKAIGFLVGQDQKRATDAKEEIDNAIEGIMADGLNIASNGYSEKRIKDLIGDDNEIISRELKGEELRVVDITITRDIALPKDSASRMEFAMTILEQKPSKEQVEVMFAIMAASSIEDVKAILSGNSEAEETYARMENSDMQKGISRPPAKGEDHQMHKRIHDLVIKNPNSSQEVKLLVATHNMEHDQYAGMEAASETAKGQLEDLEAAAFEGASLSQEEEPAAVREEDVIIR